MQRGAIPDMTDSLSKLFRGDLTRRGLFGRGGLAALLGAGGAAALPEPGQAALEIGPKIYDSIGVRPVINCKGTFTIMSGSLSLPEVKQAMMEASKHYVHIDDLMAAVGKRIAELAGSESAIVTCGCASALVHATAACIAGGDPEKMQRLPDLTGMKDEVIAPDYSRNVYDHAVRMVGVKMVNVSSLDEMRLAIGPRTAMVMVLATTEDTGPFGLEPICKLAHEHGVPCSSMRRRRTSRRKCTCSGADLVAYSGGKALRGPQSAGVLLGKKDLIRAAWMNSSPHHAFGRPMKIGKEDIMGMLAAVEMWFKRDHAAESRPAGASGSPRSRRRSSASTASRRRCWSRAGCPTIRRACRSPGTATAWRLRPADRGRWSTKAIPGSCWAARAATSARAGNPR